MRRLAWLPALLLAFWVERNCTLPWIPKEFGWPWVFVDGGLADHLLWNSAFVLVLTIVSIALYRSRMLPWTRVLVIGILGLMGMSLWQPTGRVLYQIIPHAVLSSFLSFFVFWSAIGMAFRFEENKRKVACLLLGAVFITPFLTLDRTLVGLGVFIFFLFQRSTLAREN